MMANIAVVSTSRADVNSLLPVAQELRKHGHAVMMIGNAELAAAPEGVSLKLAPPVLTPPTALGLLASDFHFAAYVGKALEGFDAELVVVCGDRHETLSVAFAAALMGIPLAHIAGGDITGGSSDEQYRHAITKLAHLHFVTSQGAQRVVARMGEPPENIVLSGSPATSTIARTPIDSRDATCKALGVDVTRPFILANWQPETPFDYGFESMVQALLASREQVVAVGANDDPGAQVVNERWQELDRAGLVRFAQSLPPALYLSAMNHARVLVGNSSSGFYEAPYFGLPVLNIGKRQAGREEPNNMVTLPGGDVDQISFWLKTMMDTPRGLLPRVPLPMDAAVCISNQITARLQAGIRPNKRFVQ